jgi:hypothetical protein
MSVRMNLRQLSRDVKLSLLWWPDVDGGKLHSSSLRHKHHLRRKDL